MSSYKHDDRLEIVFKKTSEFGTINRVAIHLKTNNFTDVLDAINTAARDSFDLIIIYSDALVDRYCRSLKNKTAFKKRSMYDFLKNNVCDDVHIGEVSRMFGDFIGWGFSMYNWR